MPDTNKIHQTIDTSLSDRKFVARFEDDLDMLTSMVEEMFVETRAMLLSSVFRRMLLDKSRLVRARFDKIKGRIAVDNPCDDFKLES